MRQKSIAVTVRNQQILERIKKLKEDHPCWGYRRIWAYLHYREGLPVNKKRIYRLMKEEKLLVIDTRKFRAKRTDYRPKPKPERMNHMWGIDMTKIMIPTYGWVYLVVALDWYTKKIVGYSLGLQSKTRDWLFALQEAVLKQFPEGIRNAKKLFLISDNGSQVTSQAFMKECGLLGIKQIFASYNNPKGNADTERVMRTIKEDLVWPYDWVSVDEFQQALASWIVKYNTDFPHSAISYRTPQQFEDILKSEASALLNQRVA